MGESRAGAPLSFPPNQSLHARECHALDGESGRELWRIYLGGSDLGSLGNADMATSPITYLANGRQLVSMASGHALFTFELGEAK